MKACRSITWSASLTVPLTHDCPWRCRYCGYRSDNQGLITEAELTRLFALAARQGATEILFLSGEIPDSLPHLRAELKARGFANFIEFTRYACERALDMGFLPHTNIGALSRPQFERLAEVNASLGLMLENIDDTFNRTVAPEKSVAGRLKTIALAGELRIPYTSGILIGLGESPASRLRSLDALAELHARHGHLQEIILQNFLPNSGSMMREAPPQPTLAEYLELIAHWRSIASEVAIQIPPNLNPHWRDLLPLIDDLGGISADGDLVNPDNPWAPPEVYAEACAAQGLELRHRWPVYDTYIARGWISQRVQAVLTRRAAERASASAGAAGEPSLWLNPVTRSRDVLSRASEGTPLAVDDALWLIKQSGSVTEELRAAADTLNRSLHGDVVTYVVNRNANFTNVCETNCTFCGFYRPKGHTEAYTRSVQMVVERIAQTPWVTEVCLQGGIHPELDFDYYCELLRGIKAMFPAIHIHAYSPMEIYSLHLKTGRSYASLFAELRAAGLDSIPGTAAEILDDSLRDDLSPRKLRVADWVEIVTAAHRTGLRSTSTVMFGHRESWDQILRHMALLRDLQHQTGGFTEFIPLAFVPYKNRLGNELAKARTESLETIASRGRDMIQQLYPLARLFFGREIPHLQTSWVKLGPETAAAMLQCGCDDFGGTLYEESITRESGGKFGECLTPAQIETAIRSVGKVPRQRTTLYQPIQSRIAQTALA